MNLEDVLEVLYGHGFVDAVGNEESVGEGEDYEIFLDELPSSYMEKSWKY